MFDVSGTLQINRNGEGVTRRKESTKKQQDMSGFHFCHQERVQQHRNTSSALKLLYQCNGKSYDKFTDKLYQLVHDEHTSNNNKHWGMREYPVPKGKTILLLGNSHLRQVSKTLACEYGSVIESIDSHSEDIFTVKFTNGATWITVTNTILVHSHSWPLLIETYFFKDIPFASVDAIVLGKFTSHQEAYNTNYALQMSAEQDFYADTLGQPVDFETIAPPTLVSLARIHSNLILATTMFAVSDRIRAQTQWEDFETEFPNRRNVQQINSRTYIERLGLECGSDDKYTLGTCHEPGDKNLRGNRSPADMHRCAGAFGGHADLVAWDIVEALHMRLSSD